MSIGHKGNSIGHKGSSIGHKGNYILQVYVVSQSAMDFTLTFQTTTKCSAHFMVYFELN